MKYLVIGGAGYIGSHVVQALLAAQQQVVVLDNMRTGYASNVPSNVELINADLMDHDALDSTMSQGFDVVIHLAALKAAGESMDKVGMYADQNITGTIGILNAMAKHNVKKFVFSSSAAVYGSPQYVPIDEKHPLNPENFYGFTKLECERIARWYKDLKGIKCAFLRYFNAAGYHVDGKVLGKEKNPANLLPIVMEVASGVRKDMQVFGNDYDTRDGSCVRDYVHVMDLADAHVKAAEKLSEHDEILVNLGSEKGYTVLEVLNEAEKIVGRPIAHQIVGRRAGDPAVVVASSAKAREILGWEPEYSDLKTLLESMWEVYKQ